MKPEYDVAVIGAGIVGAAIAFRLSNEGQKVLVLDRSAPGLGCSFGNAGMIAISEFVPLSSRETLLKAPAMLLQKNGPLSIDPLYLRHFLPWALRFTMATRKSQFKAGIACLSQLCADANSDTQKLLSDAGISEHYIANDCVRVFRTEADYLKVLKSWDLRRQHGMKNTFLDRPELEKLFPALSPGQNFGAMIEGYHLLRDPLDVTQGLIAAANQNGSTFLLGDVKDVTSLSKTCVRVETADGAEYTARNVVISAGAWSHFLTSKLGDKIPLETERGYHVEFKNPGLSFDRSIVSMEHSLAVSPMTNGLRCSSFVEFAGLKKPPNESRYDTIIKRAKAFFPTLNIKEYSVWMGHRPSLPDSLPVISASRHYPNIYYCFGHGHTGVTLAATSARLVSNMIDKTLDSKLIDKLSADRFSSHKSASTIHP